MASRGDKLAAAEEEDVHGRHSPVVVAPALENPQDKARTPAAAQSGASASPAALRKEIPSIGHLDELSRLNIFPPEWIEDQLQIHEEALALFKEIEDDLEKNRCVRYELDEASRIEFNEWSRKAWAEIDFSGIIVSSPSDPDDCIGASDSQSKL